MTTFNTFKNALGAEMSKRAFGLDLDGIDTWQEYREAALANRVAFGGIEGFYERLERQFGVFSTGERALLVACLYAIDYRHVAETFCNDHGTSFLSLMEYADEPHRAAAAAAIMELDERPAAERGARPFDTLRQAEAATEIVAKAMEISVSFDVPAPWMIEKGHLPLSGDVELSICAIVGHDDGEPWLDGVAKVGHAGMANLLRNSPEMLAALRIIADTTYDERARDFALAAIRLTEPEAVASVAREMQD